MLNVQFDCLACETNLLPERVRDELDQKLALYEAGELECDFDYIGVEMTLEEVEQSIRNCEETLRSCYSDKDAQSDRGYHVIDATKWSLLTALTDTPA